MDYHKVAKEVLMEIVGHSHKAFHKTTDDISRGENKMIVYLYALGDKISAGELSEKMDVSSARVATILNNMEKKGLIIRETDNSDKRKIVVFLTPEGDKTGRAEFDRILKYITELFTRLGEEDTRNLIELTRKVIGLINEIICCDIKTDSRQESDIS